MTIADNIYICTRSHIFGEHLAVEEVGVHHGGLYLERPLEPALGFPVVGHAVLGLADQVIDGLKAEPCPPA